MAAFVLKSREQLWRIGKVLSSKVEFAGSIPATTVLVLLIHFPLLGKTVKTYPNDDPDCLCT